jgi:hypothetical protein
MPYAELSSSGGGGGSSGGIGGAQAAVDLGPVPDECFPSDHLPIAARLAWRV